MSEFTIDETVDMQSFRHAAWPHVVVSGVMAFTHDGDPAFVCIPDVGLGIDGVLYLVVPFPEALTLDGATWTFDPKPGCAVPVHSGSAYPVRSLN